MEDYKQNLEAHFHVGVHIRLGPNASLFLSLCNLLQQF